MLSTLKLLQLDFQLSDTLSRPLPDGQNFETSFSIPFEHKNLNLTVKAKEVESTANPVKSYQFADLFQLLLKVWTAEKADVNFAVQIESGKYIEVELTAQLI